MMTVITNRHRQTGIVVKRGTKLAHCVLMDASGLTVTRMAAEEFAEWNEIAGDAQRAVKQFLAAGERFGITALAKQLLEEAQHEQLA